MSVGILVSPNEEGEPVLDSWKMSTKFEEFMHTKGTLEIMEDNVEASATPERSIIRLLKKAQELNMDYTLPNSEWMESLHGDVILPYYKNDLDSLEAIYKDVIYSRFDLVPIDDGKLFMYALKGREIMLPSVDEIEFITSMNGYNNRGRHYGWKNNNRKSNSGGCTNNCSDNSGSRSVATCTENCYCNLNGLCSKLHLYNHCITCLSNWFFSTLLPSCSDMPMCTEDCYSYGNGNTNMSGCRYVIFHMHLMVNTICATFTHACVAVSK